jgi:Uncharacterized protein conserved in bacteria (DUF2147)
VTARHLAFVLAGVLAGLLTLPAGRAGAQDGLPSATGLWRQIDDRTGESQGWFLIYEAGGVYEGAIAKMFLKPGDDPHPICTRCQGDQKDKPSLGLTIIKNMQRNGLNYEKGTILDPRDGNVYNALMQLSPDGQSLTVRGYLGIALFGRNQVWHRLPNSDLAQVDCAVIAEHVPALLPAACRGAGARPPRRAPALRGPVR